MLGKRREYCWLWTVIVNLILYQIFRNIEFRVGKTLLRLTFILNFVIVIIPFIILTLIAFIDLLVTIYTNNVICDFYRKNRNNVK